MAYRRGRRSAVRKSIRRRNYRRNRSRRYRRNQKAPRFSNYAPFGKTVSVNHRYVETVTINPSAAVSGDNVFSANGMYDPNITGTGHQPYGFDQMAALYDHFAVTGSRITIMTSTTQTVPYWIAICLRDTSGSLSGYGTEVFLEQPGIRKVLIDPTVDTRRSISFNFSARKFFTTKDVVGSPELNGSSSLDPIEAAYYHVLLLPYGSDDLVPQKITVQVDYHAVWSEPRMVTQS